MSTATMSSFQYAPSSISGWNDCPTSLQFNSSHPRTKRRNFSGSSTLSIESLDSLCSVKECNKSSSSSITSSLEKRPSPVSSPLEDSVYKFPSTSSSEETVEDLLNKLLKLETTLSQKEFQYHTSKLKNKDILNNVENSIFLKEILNDFFTQNNFKSIEIKILDFMMAHTGISWCCSLKKILSSVN
ncbi:hypothetical protein CANARDRAFT_25219 [[Candida] arabinofermentans NRRL YB-2248]|uniref:Uncharacterized protein n=1 Tax=[Candida] arabinofermentans NRRL YB-2248 TaxID=983967 RepID=A0A1E4SUY7_9ASCO|nr:hypothetical protein CANARDRAFT_25219 [[Candida] arabinofermentans NRRL YB-2248]